MFLRRLSHWIAPAVIVWLFGSTLIGEDRLAFRDVSHFYTPLYDYVAQRTADDWLPLWNPLDQTGMPLIGETTTAVFYPIRVIVFSLFSSTALAWYVALHLMLASIAGTWAARRNGVSESFATIAGICYSLCGSVLFLYTNPPFLVGAAWLPFVLGSLVGKKPMKLRTRCLVGGFSLAMMVLGGDPQTALHGVMIACAVWLVRLRKPSIDFSAKHAAISIVGASLLAAALAAPQIAASISWSRQSERVNASSETSWHSAPVAGSVRSDAYQFSLSPWQAAELLTPNAFGEPFPINRRLTPLVSSESRMWTPTIYISMFALIAIVASITSVRRSGIDSWSVIAVAALLLSLGHFGIVWALQQFPGVLPSTDSAIGGAYWWLYQFFPGYSSFRYPAKWLPVFSLSVSIITAKYFQRILESPNKSELDSTYRTFFAPVAVVSIGIVIAYAVLIGTITWIESAPRHMDEYWGPLDVAGGISQIRWSLLHSAVIVSVIVAIVWLARRNATKHWCVFALLLVIAVDLGVSVRGVIATTNVMQEMSVLAETDTNGPAIDESFLFRTIRNGGWPSEWQDSTNEKRIDEVAVGERLALFGRWHLKDRVAVWNNMTSISSQSMSLFWRSANEFSVELEPSEQRRFWLAICNWMSVTDTLSVTNRGSNESSKNPRFALPAVNIKSLRDGSEPANATTENWQEVDTELTDEHQMREMVRQIYAEESTRKPLVENSQTNISYEPGFLFRSKPESYDGIGSDRDVLFVRRVFQDGNWIAVATNTNTNERKPLTVQKVDFLKQGVVLPAGTWNLQFFYAPRWLGSTLLLAAITWTCGLLFTLGIAWQWKQGPGRERHAVPNPATAVSSSDRPEH